jgi:ABC-2 type transport system permease protein/lipopolysaccharide transport system permease protein
LFGARDLVIFLALRDVQIRYKQAVLGILWVLLQPAATVVIFTIVFSRLTDLYSQEVPYPLFALVGMIVWLYFSTGVTRASEVLVGNPALVTKVYFPRIAAPASAMLSPMIDLLVSAALLVPLLAYYRVTPSIRILAVPAWLALLVLVTLGVGLWLSALNVRYRDVRHAVGPIMQIWLFASPVAYPITMFPDKLRLAFGLNPMTGVIGLARWSLLDAPWPGWPLGVSVLVTIGLVCTGLMYFNRAERTFADVI